MKEEFLHFVWNTRNFNFIGLKTTEGKPVEILDFGLLNDGGGPDFHNARLRIDGTTWAGNIEMHVMASDWDRHGHGSDPKYDSVILHVVLEEDTPIRHRHRRLPCIELRGRINHNILGNYRRLLQSRAWVPCENHLEHIDDLQKQILLERMLAERLESKVQPIYAMLGESQNDWDSVFIRLLIERFGFGANQAPFARLARLVPVREILRKANTLVEIEAILFGCAGMLNRIFIDPYPVRLQQLFHHSAHKLQLQAMNAEAWEWGRVRPANFPTIRIAQLCRLLAQASVLTKHLLHMQSVEELRSLFRVEVSEYWQDHPTFDRKTEQRAKALGSSTINTLLINAVIPFLFSFGKLRSQQQICDRAVNFASAIKPEMHRITKRWMECTMPNTSAGHSQALIHLKKVYCDKHRCSYCTIGQRLLAKQTNPDV